MKNCSITGCNNKYIAKGLCSTHRKINKKYGTPIPVCWCGEPAQTFVGNQKASDMCEEHTLLKRFWNNVDIKSVDECWEWQGSKTSNNYGVIYWNGKVSYAHRLSLEFSGEEIPSRYHACHRCDNPPCVNPKHLFVGSPRDNMLDKVSKGRHTFGEKHPNAKLTNAEVLAIRDMAEDGVFFSDIARTFGVSDSHISTIVARLKRSDI
jgi:hypothetical protein